MKATEWSRRAEDSDDNEVERRLRAQYHQDEQFQYPHGPQPPRGSVSQKFVTCRL